MALQMIAHDLAHGKRQVAMDTAVLEGDRRAILLAEKHDRLAEDHPPKGLARTLEVVRGDVPEIPEEHGVLRGGELHFAADGSCLRATHPMVRSA